MTKINVTSKFKFELGRVQNIVEKGENAGYKNFLLFQQYFQKPSSPRQPSPIAQLATLQTWEQEVAGSIPGSTNILSED